MNYLIFVIAIGLLIWGTQLIITQSAKISLRLQIPEFVIGATLIALGTSIPEITLAMTASYYHKGDIATSNIIGSNILNITLILGTLFIFSKKIRLHRNFFSKNSTLLLMSLFLSMMMLLDGLVSRFDGILLILFMGAYLLFLLQECKNRPHVRFTKLKQKKIHLRDTFILLLFAFILIAIGGYLTIESSSEIASQLKISQWYIGLILIAFSTSLPELILSILAIFKNRVDMAIGNLIGSNIANMTLAIGISALISPIKSDIYLHPFDLFILVGISFIVPFIMMNRLYTKPMGIALLIIFTLFIHQVANQLPL